MLSIKHHLLLESSQQTRDFLNDSFSPALILNKENQVIMSNRQADELFNLTEESKLTFFG
jgi:hypothetical protein